MLQKPSFTPQIRLYQNWLKENRGISFDNYDALWRWSVTDLNAFWQSIWDYFDLQSPTPHDAALVRNTMPNAKWFVGAQTNYVQQVFRHCDAAHAAGLAALRVPEEGIVDYAAVMRKMAELILAAGHQIRINAPALGIRSSGGRQIICTPQGYIEADFVINCAGLHCDRVARSSGMPAAGA
jgi:hypothetical protein